jgi:hypothetical protein
VAVKEIVSDVNLVAYCGLYCGACGAYLKGRCAGCHDTDKRAWCKIRTCCRQADYASCADCKVFGDPNDCRTFNNLIAKVFGLIFRSDRAACIRQIRELGVRGHADAMARAKAQTIKR